MPEDRRVTLRTAPLLEIHPMFATGERDGRNGLFVLVRDGVRLKCVVSDGGGWDHVSVSPHDLKRCPTWEEMDFVKRTFFDDGETAMQLHVPPADHISHHPYCLHLWRPQAAQIPRPDSGMVL